MKFEVIEEEQNGISASKNTRMVEKNAHLVKVCPYDDNELLCRQIDIMLHIKTLGMNGIKEWLLIQKQIWENTSPATGERMETYRFIVGILNYYFHMNVDDFTKEINEELAEMPK